MGLFELFVEDEVTAAWMPINNTFAWPPPPTIARPPEWDIPKQHRADKYWHGILVQLGKPRMFQSSVCETVLDKVVLMNTAGGARDEITEETLRQTPTYLVVESSNGRNSRPMDKTTLQALNRSTADKDWVGQSLHENFESYHGGILLWPDRDAEYEIRSFRRASGGYHHSFRFILPSRGGFRVTAYRLDVKDWFPETYENVDRIEALVSRHAQTHGDPDIPPKKP